jgi:4-amino-4-deoxy-L-arabinose transferase-like glycosyltransferase
MQNTQHHHTQSHLTWWLDLAFLTLTLGCLFFVLLGSRPLFVPDEGRYAEIAREMVASHDWVTPTLNGIRYFEKPILFYWLGAAAIKIGGLNLWSLRSINAILGLVGCLLTYAWTRWFYDRATGLLAACILATSSLYFVMSHMVSLDLPVTVFNTATLMAAFCAYQAKTPAGTRLALTLAAIAAALAVLTKGLIGIVFPGLVFFAFIALTHGWRRLWQLPLISSFCLFLLIAAPWHVIVNHRHPEFFYFYFIEQHFLRYTMKDIGHYQPVWFFIPTLLAGLFPWVVFLPQTLVQACKQVFKPNPERALTSFLLVWAVIIFTFFSFSKSKLIPYILPVFPPLAILMAAALRKARLKTALVSLMVLAVAVLIISVNLLKSASLPNPLAAAHIITLALGLLITGTFFSLLTLKRQRAGALALMALSSGLFLIMAFSAFPDMDSRTILPLTQALQPILKPNDDVITYDQYYQDLPFYLQRQVSILNWHNELTYGMAHQDTRAFMINDAEFWKRWRSQQRVFVFINLQELVKLEATHPDLNAKVLATTTNTAVITNKSN